MPYPIEHVSFSAMMMFLRNRAQFEKIYIHKIRENKNSPATAVGSSFHKCMEVYYMLTKKTGDHPSERELAKKQGELHLSGISSTIDWGKTGSLDKAMESYFTLVNTYFEVMPVDPKTVLLVEEALVEKVKGFVLPIKAIPDLVARGANGSIYILDFKTTASLDDVGVIPHEYIIQGWFYYWAVAKHLKMKPTHINFLQIKASTNRDGRPQINEIIYPFSESSPDCLAVRELLRGMLREVRKSSTSYLPNLADMMTGEESWGDFVGKFVDARATVEFDKMEAVRKEGAPPLVLDQPLPNDFNQLASTPMPSQAP